MGSRGTVLGRYIPTIRYGTNDGLKMQTVRSAVTRVSTYSEVGFHEHGVNDTQRIGRLRFCCAAEQVLKKRFLDRVEELVESAEFTADHAEKYLEDHLIQW